MKGVDNILLIHKVISGEATEIEIRNYNSWVDSNIENKRLAEEISFIWFIGGESKVNTSFAIQKEKSKERLFSVIDAQSVESLDSNMSLEEDKVVNIRKYMSIAAVFLFLIAAIFMFKQINNSSNKINSVYSNALAEVNIVDLPDKSRVWLNKNSIAKYISVADDNERKLVLEGNGFFEIKRDVNRPFTIEINNHKIKVLGTSFQIFVNDENNVGVNVYSGIVEFTSPSGKSKVLKVKEGAVYDSTLNKFVNVEEKDFLLNSKFSYLTFNNMDLEKVFEKLSNYFDVEIKIECSSIENMIGYTSPQHVNDDIKNYFSTIEKLYNVEITRINEKHFEVNCK